VAFVTAVLPLIRASDVFEGYSWSNESADRFRTRRTHRQADAIDIPALQRRSQPVSHQSDCIERERLKFAICSRNEEESRDIALAFERLSLII